MKLNYEFVKYSVGYRSQIIELQKHLWSPDSTLNAAYFEWKYEKNPYLERPLIYLALYQGKVVGMRGFYGVCWQMGQPERIIPALCSGDLVIAPAHRNRGLFAKIMQVALKDLSSLGFAYVFSLSGGSPTRIMSLATGWSYVGTVDHVYSTRRADEEFDMRTHAHKPDTHISIEEVPRPEAMARLIDRLGHDGRLRHVRDNAFFSWRFQNPLSRFQFVYWDGRELEGYLVLQTRIASQNVRYAIVDWEATDMQVRNDLLKAVRHSAGWHRLDVWTTSLSDELATLLQRHGFVTQQGAGSLGSSRTAILIRSTQDLSPKSDPIIDNQGIFDLENWDLRMIYSDNY